MAFEFAPGYVIHRVAWGETGALVDVLLRDQGRLTLSARGVHKPKSKLKPLLEPFTPLLLSARGAGPIPLLIGLEVSARVAPLRASALIAGLYLNELLLHLLPRQEPISALFASYARTLATLREDNPKVALALRQFERVLLETLGVAPDWRRDARSDWVEARAFYRLVDRDGFHRCAEISGDAISGSELIAISASEPFEPTPAINRMFRRLIDDALGGRPLRSRELWPK